MAGIVGTAGMLAEASGYGAVLDVEAVPTPDASADATLGDWLGCFPGFGMITADRPGQSRMNSAYASTSEVGSLTLERGVVLRWPDGESTRAVSGAGTGLGRA